MSLPPETALRALWRADELLDRTGWHTLVGEASAASKFLHAGLPTRSQGPASVRLGRDTSSDTERWREGPPLACCLWAGHA